MVDSPGFGHASDNFDAAVLLPKPSQALLGQGTHAQDQGIRAELLLNLGERSRRRFGNKRNDFHSSPVT